ncbi:MAG: hypothetical protein HOQ08_08590, partial [Frateuria sp.]|nr:hypothetical protein [Frateuria sp.]
ASARSGDCASAAAQARAAQALIGANGMASHPELAAAAGLLHRPIASCGILLD